MNEPISRTLSQDGWIAGALEAITESARWNRRAALWSAAAVAFTALSGLMAALGW